MKPSYKYITEEELDPKYKECIFNHTPLCDVINYGDEQKAIELINNGVRINYLENNFIDTPLGLSLYLGLYEVPKTLLNKEDLQVNVKDKELLKILTTKFKEPELSILYHKIYIQNLDFDINDDELLYIFFNNLKKSDLDDLINRIYERTKILTRKFVNSYFKINLYYLLEKFIEKGGEIENNIDILKTILKSDLSNKNAYDLFLKLNNKAFDIHENENDFINSVLYLAMIRDNKNNYILDYLLKYDVKIDYTINDDKDLLIQSLKQNNEFSNLIENNNYHFIYRFNSVFVYAIYKNNYKIIEHLINHKIDINGDTNDITQTYIYLSVLLKRYKIALLLLENNVKIDYDIKYFNQSLLYKLLNIISVNIDNMDEFHQLKNKLYEYYKQTDIFKKYLTDNNIIDDKNVLNVLCEKLQKPFENKEIPRYMHSCSIGINTRNKIIRQRKYIDKTLLNIILSQDYNKFSTLINNDYNRYNTNEYSKEMIDNLNILKNKETLHSFKDSYLYEALKLKSGMNSITENQKEIIKMLIKLYSGTYTEYDYYKLCNINNNNSLDIIINKLVSYVNNTI